MLFRFLYSVRVRRIATFLLLLAILCGCAAPAVQATPPSTVVPSATSLPAATATSTLAPMQPTASSTAKPEKVMWGIYPGPFGLVKDKEAIEKDLMAQMDVVATFVHLGNENEFPTELAANAKADHQILLIFWEMLDYNEAANDSRFSCKSLADPHGQWHEAMVSFVGSIPNDQPIVVAPMNEGNGNWVPFGIGVNGNDAATCKQAFRLIASLFASLPNVQIAWAMNTVSNDPAQIKILQDLYPGDDVVSILGLDGFSAVPGDPWMDPDTLFGSALKSLHKIAPTKPIWITSVAAKEDARKAKWILDLGNFVRGNGVEAVIWFNEDKRQYKEFDWRYNSNPKAAEAFKDMIGRLNP
jgi:hypothetical protein